MSYFCWGSAELWRERDARQAAMQGLADALRSARNAIEFSQRLGIVPPYSFELIDAALEAAKPFLEEKP